MPINRLVNGGVMRVRRVPARLGAVLLCLVGYGLLTGAPASAAPGFNIAFTELPSQFTAGAGPATVTAVVAKDSGDDCLKVRWSMVLRVEGFRPDQVRVDRIEDGGPVPLAVWAEGEDTARFTDQELDPGTLCQNGTVTARYQLSVAGDVTAGSIALGAEAYDERLRLLSRQVATREVVGYGARSGATVLPSVEPSPTESAEPSPTELAEPLPTDSATADDPTDEPAATDGDDPTVEAASGAGSARADRASVTSGIGRTQVAFLSGGLMVFLGAGMLLGLLFRPVIDPRRRRPRR